MATQPSTVEYFLDQLNELGDIVVKPMFGEYGVWLGGKIVGLICDDLFFLKPTPVGKEMTSGFEELPPYPGAKPSIVIPAEKWEDRDWMTTLLRKSTDQLPAPKAKKPK